MLHNDHDALVVDPGDAQVVFAALQSEGLRLRGILVTHHHQDHTGGVRALHQATQAAVFGPASEPMPEPIRRLAEGDNLELLGLRFQVLDVPGHTAGHIAYFCASVPAIFLEPAGGSRPLLFCGDTLFSAGCGRLLGGTAQQLLASLERLSVLPADTAVCCTHEYTLGNLKFAQEIEPDNPHLATYAARCHALRAQGLPTLPSSIAQERQINPFLRSRVPTVVQAAQRFDAAGVEQHGAFATLRQWKNQYR